VVTEKHTLAKASRDQKNCRV